MEYFRLDTIRRQDPEYCFVAKAPEGLGLASWKLAKGVALADEYPADAAVQMASGDPGLRVTDFVANKELMLVVSRPVKEALERVNRGPIEYLPVTIVNHKGRVASSSHFIVNPLGTYDCLDHERSDIVLHEGEVVSVRTYVLDPKKLERVPDVFRVQEDPSEYFISERIVDALLELEPPPTNTIIFPVEVADAEAT